MMPIQLDGYAAGVYQRLFEEKKVTQFYGMGAREFVLDELKNCNKVILQDGTEIQVDLVINCAGVRPNVEFLKDSPILCDKCGLVIDKYGRTNVEDVFGAGDVTGRSPVWPAAVREGITAAYAMSGILKEETDYFTPKSSMYFLDVPTVSIGKVNGFDNSYNEIIRKSPDSYEKIIVKDGVIVGALLQGDISESGKLAEAVRLGKEYEKEY